MGQGKPPRGIRAKTRWSRLPSLPCCCGLICSRNIIKDLPARPPLRPQTVGCTTSITGTFPSRLKVHIGSGSLAGQDLLDCVAVFPRPKSKIQKKWKTTRPGLIPGKLERQETQSVALGVLLLPCWFAVFACRAAVIYSAPVPMSSATLVLVCCANLRIFENGARA